MDRLKIFGKGFIAFVLSLFLCLSVAQAGKTYDMDIFINQPYPFAALPVANSTSRPTSVPDTSWAAKSVSASSSALPSSNSAGGEIVSEIRIGVLLHDEGPFSHQKEGGIDGNLEILFTSPDMLDLIGSPRPHIGATVNLQGDTSQVYTGLSWEWGFLDDAFAGFSLGGALHDGATRTDALDKKELGCKVLFRESIDVGYRFFKRHAVMAHLEHISNARLCGKNEGLENFGIRYGYKF